MFARDYSEAAGNGQKCYSEVFECLFGSWVMNEPGKLKYK